ncbi:MAG: hypothetical protein FVQ83_16160 [Chloroflexi bacterium]|nr:hypothetical protein [Chloroflexota bacterium]
MNDDPQGESNLKEEFRNLGNHLKQAMNAAWESDERKDLQHEVKASLTELGSILNQLADDFNTSETGQKIHSDVEDLGERIRSGEVEENIRAGILSALQQANTELKKAVDKFGFKGGSMDDEKTSHL